MGYRSCLGIIRLAEQYSSTRMEAAADRAIRKALAATEREVDPEELARPTTTSRTATASSSAIA